MKLPAGKYYIGDPCYVIDEDRWSDFVDASFGSDQKGIAVTEFDGHPMYAHGTAYGDGCYLGSDGVRYGVDAGMLSVVPLALCLRYEEDEMKSEMVRLGSIVDFKEDFTADRNYDCTFHFGHIDIPTGDTDEEDDESFDLRED